MGSHTFQHTVLGKGMTPEKAYTTLVSDALHSAGHDPYNGTISTTEGFVTAKLHKGARLDDRIENILEGRVPEYKDIEKWGPAGCIELTGAALTKLKKGTRYAGTRARGYIFFGWAAS